VTGVDIALLLLAVAALAGLSRLLPARRGQDEPADLAGTLGLEAQGEELYAGLRGDRRVRAELHPGSTGTTGMRLMIELRRALAPGLDLDVSERGVGHVLGLHTAVVSWEPGEDGPLLLGLGEDPIRASLSAPRGLDFSPVRHDPVLEDVELRLAITVRQDELEIGFPRVAEARLGSLVEACLELVELLEEEEDRPWREAAEAHGLRLEDGRIRGRCQGMAVLGSYADQTVIEVDLSGRGLPEGLRIRHGGPVKLGSPVLDLLVGMEREVTLPPAFQEPELAEALLAVVHQFPGSALESSRVRLVAPGRLREDLEPALAACLRLAGLLAC
jgi:hypothetical protein